MSDHCHGSPKDSAGDDLDEACCAQGEAPMAKGTLLSRRTGLAATYQGPELEHRESGRPRALPALPGEWAHSSARCPRFPGVQGLTEGGALAGNQGTNYSGCLGPRGPEQLGRVVVLLTGLVRPSGTWA